MKLVKMCGQSSVSSCIADIICNFCEQMSSCYKAQQTFPLTPLLPGSGKEATVAGRLVTRSVNVGGKVILNW